MERIIENGLEKNILIYNTLTRTKERFKPIVPGKVGLYVCGPTVYGDAHLGHARPAITFDVLVRLFRKLGYKVRYVRNITDVGHLEHDADEGEDKIAKKAKLEQLEPMEIAHNYTLRFRDAVGKLNTLPPSIEPQASGHIIEQINLVKKILDAGYAYISNGSVYFDVVAYNRKYKYGILSGRNIEEQDANTRELDGQSDKHASFDFALWKKAQPEHIMRWPSPWSDGFPGWHLECSAMSEKYLGKEFDIHGGGMDLMFPHHECEIAQNTISRGNGGVHYWMHNNMITINGQKMGKSYGNFITLDQLFTGNHPILEQAYSPMTIRFFILQAHYRSTLDFSNAALQAAQKGLERVLAAARDVQNLKAEASGEASASDEQILKIKENVWDALLDDLNTPIALSHIFDAVKIVNSAKAGGIKLSQKGKDALVELFSDVLCDVLGVCSGNEAAVAGPGASAADEKLVNGLMSMILEQRAQAKANKDWAASDAIRDRLKELGVQLKDSKEGTEWTI